MSTIISLSEAAKALNVSEKSIRRYIKSGKIKAKLIKGQRGYEYEIDDSELLQFSKPPRGKSSHKEFLGKKDLIPEQKREIFKEISKENINQEQIEKNEMTKVGNITEKSREKIVEMKEQKDGAIDYRILYEKLFAKYEQSLIIIGSLEAQLRTKNLNDNIREKQVSESMARQEELILELYQLLKLYEDRR